MSLVTRDLPVRPSRISKLFLALVLNKGKESNPSLVPYLTGINQKRLLIPKERLVFWKFYY